MRFVAWTIVLGIFALALTAGVSAQENLNFANLPLVNSPSPLPSGYGQLNWSNLYYVDPYLWGGAGPGDELGPENQDVAFVGSRECRNLDYACFGTLTATRGFQLVAASLAGSRGPTSFTVMAYNNGSFVGQTSYFVTTSLRTIQFPAS